VAQGQLYIVTLTPLNLSSGVVMRLVDADNHPVDAVVLGNGTTLEAFLQPGIYGIGIVGTTAAPALGVLYRIQVTFVGNAESPPTLTIGPAPATRIRFVDSPPPPPPVPLVSVPSSATDPSQRLEASSGTYLHLGATSLGGVTAPGIGIEGSLDDRVLVQIPTQALDRVLQVAVLTQSGFAETSKPSGSPGVAANAAVLQNIAKSLGQTVIDFARSWTDAIELLFGGTPPAPHGAEIQVEPDASTPPAENPEQGGTDPLRADSFAEHAWMSSLVVAGLVSGADPNKVRCPWSSSMGSTQESEPGQRTG
jgi:hypothetical protein